MTTAQRPTPGLPREYHFPQFERRRLPNGLRLCVAPVRKLPVVTVMMVTEAGAVSENRGEEGIAELTARMLLEGTGSWSGTDITERLERLGASLEASADWDVSSLAMTVLKTRLPEAFRVFAQVMRNPSFPAREVDRLRSERLAELLQTRTEPRTLATEMFARFLYDPESRYSLPEGGSEATVASLTRAKMVAFYESRFQAGGTTIILAGDVSGDEAEELIAQHLGGWAARDPGIATPVLRVGRTNRAIHIVAKEDAPQSEVRVGHVGIPRAHPDFYDVLVMNAILGGLFSSRINLNLREAHGYTYGASSIFDWRRHSGPFVVSTAVRSDVTDAAVREILLEIDRIRSEPVPEDELTLATSFLDGVFPIKYETTNAIAHALATLVVYGLPDEYFEQYRLRVRQITPERVLTAARNHLHPEQLQIVVVGDAAAIRDPLARLRGDPAMIYDSEGSALG
ncbi:MAG TPA: pitrilysin family protein [Gemmatimonadaceae bacterium]|nr:pitrilysin family protein [Gemmatimonadaceae bacterium]